MKQTKQLVPELRFPEFDGEWKQDSLNKLANVNPRTRKLPDEFIYIDLESVTEGKLVKEETVFADEAPSRAQRVLDKGDILYQTVRPYQKNNYFFNKDGDYVASTGYAQIKAKYYSKYLFQFLHNQKFVNIVNRWSTGTSYPAISPSELVKIKINYPTAPEQQKIADFLSQVDRKIDLLQQKVAALAEYKKGVMQQLFSQEVRFKRGLSGAEGQDDGSDYPDWEEKKLGEISIISKGKQLNKSKLNEFGEYASISGGIEPSGYTNQWNTEKDTIIISEGGNSCGYVNFIKTRFWCGGHCYKIEIKLDKLSKDFLFQALKFNQIKIMRLRVGSGLPNIQKKDLSKFKVYLPTLKEQTKIANFLSSIDQKIAHTQEQLEQTQSFKKGLLQKMFV